MFLFSSQILWKGARLACVAAILLVGAVRAEDAMVRLQAELPERKFPGFEEVLRRAVDKGPSVVIREWEAAMAAEQTRGARAPLLPSLNASVNAGATHEQRRDPTGGYTRDYTAIFYSVGFYQPLFHWGGLKNNYRIAQLRQAMTERNVTETRRLLAIDVRRRYFDVILAANTLKLARENMTQLEADKKNMEQLIADGSVAPGAIDGNNRAIDEARPALAQTENQYAVLKRSLAQIAGMSESAFDNLPSAVPALQNITEVLDALSGSVSTPSSAQLNNLYDEINVAKLDYKINKVRQLPKFGLSASVAQVPDTGYGAPKDSIVTSWNTSLSMQWNLFDGFGSQAARRASLNRLRMLEAQRTQAEQQESAERRNESAALRVQWNQLQNAERDLARAHGGMTLTEQDFANGMTSQRAVDDARANYARAEQGIYGARASFYITLASYLSNRGRDPLLQDGMVGNGANKK